MEDSTWPLAEDAFRRGHDTRVDFEDSVNSADGTTARENVQRGGGDGVQATVTAMTEDAALIEVAAG